MMMLDRLLHLSSEGDVLCERAWLVDRRGRGEDAWLAPFAREVRMKLKLRFLKLV